MLIFESSLVFKSSSREVGGVRIGESVRVSSTSLSRGLEASQVGTVCVCFV